MAVAIQAILAALPILIILVLMLGARWSAGRAGAVGLVLTFGIAWSVFGYGTRLYPELGMARATGGAVVEAVFIAATILWIIFPALCIHELQLRTGSIDVLRMAMGRLSNDPRIVALLVAWFFVLFIEGAAGFGTSVALAAPFLVSAGFGRVEAVAVALIGHAVGVSFGALGTPILPQMAVTEFSGLEIATATGIYHALLGWVLPLAAMWFVTRMLPPEQRGGKAIWAWTVGATALFLIPFYLMSRYVGPELPTLGGALFGGVAFVGLLTLARRWEVVPGGARNLETLHPGRLLRAAAPYLVLVAVVMITRLPPGLKEGLQGVVLQWSYADTFGGSMAYLYHPGTMLSVGFIVGAWWQQAPWDAVHAAAREALRRLGPVALALVAMLALSRVMVYAGMIEVLAESTADLAGGAWPVFAPSVGMLGTFITGSATASNILFTDFQESMALQLGVSVLPMIGAQGFGAAVGNIICPHNIIAAGATVGLAGQEGEVLKRTLWPALGYSLLGGVLVFLFVAP
jgi:lactate permease